MFAQLRLLLSQLWCQRCTCKRNSHAKRQQLPASRLSPRWQLRHSFWIAQTGNQHFTCFGTTAALSPCCLSSTLPPPAPPASELPSRKTLKAEGGGKPNKKQITVISPLKQCAGMAEIRLGLGQPPQNSSRRAETFLALEVIKVMFCSSEDVLVTQST